MVNYINENRDGHIITIEDPIEYYHGHKRCVVTQREVHVDVPSFSEAIRRALRQDPDIILVGEMRDLETIEAAISAAETGHLVFGTLHTNSAAKTVDRIVDAFPANMKDMIRTQLASLDWSPSSPRCSAKRSAAGASPATRSWSTRLRLRR